MVLSSKEIFGATNVVEKFLTQNRDDEKFD